MSDNQFTLDELHLIRNNLSWNECPVVNQQLLQLNRKLEDMITDYCDHDFKNTYNEREVWECSKCGCE